MTSFLAKLKDRKLFQWALAYLAGAWALIQLADFLAETYGWPGFVMRMMPVVAAAGLLAVLVLAWYHGERGVQRASGTELMMLAGILLIGAVGIQLVRGEPEAGAAEVADVAESASLVAEQGSIAVLPFADMSPTGTQAWFSDGLSEELLNVLAQIPELRVAARTSSFSFRDTKASIDSIARVLRVEYVLEGSVRSAGEQVRITAQLIKAGTGYHVWSETYDRNLKDVFAVQDEISRAIVGALRLRIAGGAPSPAATANPKAHALVLQAMHEARQSGRVSKLKAVEYARQAVAEDPGYARAHAMLAQTLWSAAYDDYLPSHEAYRESEAEARRSIALDSMTAEAHMTLGVIADVNHSRFAEAEARFARTIELNPSLGEVYWQRAWLLAKLGRMDEALRSAGQAAALDPLSSGAQGAVGSMNMYAGRNEAALEGFAAASAINPAASFPLAGRAGRIPEAEAELKKAEALKAKQSSIAMVHMALGRRNDALSALERALREGQIEASDAVPAPDFKPLRTEPRFKAVIKRMGLPELT